MSVQIVGIEEIIRASVREELAKQPHSAPWLNVEEAADYLATTKDGIYSMVKRGDVPVHRTPNGRLLFRPEELDAWVDCISE